MTLTITDDICITFYNNHHESVDNLGGSHMLSRYQQRIYDRGEEIVMNELTSERDDVTNQ